MADDDRSPVRQDIASGGMNGISPAFIGLAVVAALALIFFFQNGRRVEINFWLFDWTTTVRWSLLVSVGLGALLDRLAVLWWRHRKRSRTTAS